MVKFSSPIMCDCDECDGTGEVTYLHSDSREWGPDYRDKECEACNGEGTVEHKCPNCGEEHDEECCEHCEGCEKCCSCTVCEDCGEKVPDGERWASYGDSKYCEKCIEEYAGVWCWENDRPCSECPMCECPDDACPRKAEKVEADMERMVAEKEDANANQ